MEKELSFNLHSLSTSNPPENIPPEKRYGAFLVHGDPDEITKLKEHILSTSLRLIYQHQDKRYLKVTPADPKDNFR
jgi:hypothetical protein